jgi:hypothetical protein
MWLLLEIFCTEREAAPSRERSVSAIDLEARDGLARASVLVS